MTMQPTSLPRPKILLGAAAGDVIGSPYEHYAVRRPDFPLFGHQSVFTDDTVLTVAVADAILNGETYAHRILTYARRFPQAGYGSAFKEWMLADHPRPYGSYGNGSAMRVSPVGWAFDSLEAVLAAAERSAAVTHNHPEGIKGAQAVAAAIFLARTGSNKDEIRREITRLFGYDLSRSLEEIKTTYKWDVTCQKSVPESIIAFLESTDFESAVRNAILLAGDADTMAAIAGSIAEAFYGGVPEPIAAEVRRRLPPDFLDILTRILQRR